MFESLSAPVANLVRRSLDEPPEDAPAVLLHQRGEMRLSPDQSWMPFIAEQRILTDRVGFVWHARVRMAPLVTAVVEDAFEDGQGRLDAKVWGLIRVAHGRGPEIDRGEAQRYLAELPWCPLAFLRNPELRVEERGDRVLRVSAFDADTWVDLHLDEAGDVVETRTTTRARGDVVQPWVGRFGDWESIGPFRLPTRGEVAWEPPGEEPFVYWRGTITDARWDRPAA